MFWFSQIQGKREDAGKGVTSGKMKKDVRAALLRMRTTPPSVPAVEIRILQHIDVRGRGSIEGLGRPSAHQDMVHTGVVRMGSRRRALHWERFGTTWVVSCSMSPAAPSDKVDAAGPSTASMCLEGSGLSHARV